MPSEKKSVWLAILSLAGVILSAPCVVPGAVPRLEALAHGKWPPETERTVQAVQVDGDYAYAAVNHQKGGTFVGGTLAVFDATDPTQCVKLGTAATNLPTPVLAVAVAWPYAFLAAGASGLHVFDVSHPARPVWVGAYDTTGVAQSVAVSGNYALVADGFAGLVILDVSNPAAPVLAGTDGAPAYAVAVSYPLALVASSSDLRVINFSNPTSMTLVSTYPGTVTSLTIAGSLAYLLKTPVGLEIVSMANPGTPALVGTNGTSGLGISVQGDFACVAGWAAGLHVLSVSNPAAPTRMGSVVTGGSATGVSMKGNHAYVADTFGGLQVITLLDPTSPMRVGGYEMRAYSFALAVSGQYAYVADHTNGLKIIDVSDPARPFRVGGYYPGLPIPEASGYQSIAVDGDYAFVGSSLNVVHIIAVTNPVAAQRVAGFTNAGSIMGVAVRGGVAFVANGTNGLQITSVTNPAAPVRLGSFVTNTAATSVAVAGDIAYVTFGTSGLVILSVTNPNAPVQLATFKAAPPGSATDVAVMGRYAYLAYGSNLRIVDVLDPAAPVLAGSYAAPFITDVAVDGRFAYVAGPGHELEVIDVGNPAQCVSVSRFRNVRAVDILAVPNRVYALGGASAIEGAKDGLFVAASIPNMRFALRVEATPGLPVTIETATNLTSPTTWVPIYSTNSSAEGFEFLDFDVNLSTQRAKFYRARQP